MQKAFRTIKCIPVANIINRSLGRYQLRFSQSLTPYYYVAQRFSVQSMVQSTDSRNIVDINVNNDTEKKITAAEEAGQTNLQSDMHKNETESKDNLDKHKLRSEPELNSNIDKQKLKSTRGLSITEAHVNYNYFSDLSNTVQGGSIGGSGINRTSTVQNENLLNEISGENSQKISEDSDDDFTVDPLQPLGTKLTLPKKSFNLAAYVNESETLQNLVKLGVDLSRIEQDVDIANYIVKLDFERDVRPYLTFLTDNGITTEDIPVCLTQNPDILRQSIDDMQVRVNYLESKRFDRDSIVRILTKAPMILSLAVKQVDANLGFLQQQFHLSGNEVRTVVTRHPKIAIWQSLKIQVMKLTFTDVGFTKEQLKKLLLAEPKLYLSGRHAIMKRFEYLHETIGFTHSDILVWPRVLRTRVSRMKERYEFLKLIGRDQFDAKKENFVSLKNLVLGRDVEFCENVAKVPVKHYNDYLKSI